MDLGTMIGSLKKKKKNKSKKKRPGSCFGPIDCATVRSRRLDDQQALAVVPFSPLPKDIAGKDQFHRRSLSGVVKAMLFGTSMAKKFRKAKQRLKIDHAESDSKSKPKSYKTQDPSETESSFLKTTSSSSLPTSPVGFSSSASSLKSSSTISKSKTILRETEGKSGSCYGPDAGLCLVLISLLVLVLWGKICAILCTSSWLFFVPRLNFGFRSSSNGGDEPPPSSMEVYSEEHKKKVVLEGFLDRNRLVHEFVH